MLLAEKKNCTACAACANICPLSYIHMKKDVEGFLYPAVDENACISCGACRSVCPVLHFSEGNDIRGIKAYACRLENRGELYRSSSGGTFVALAENILRQGGVVWGAAYDEHFAVVHQKAENTLELQALRKSKYVQSDTGYAFRHVKEELEAGRKVLFSGTPCQIGGLNAFLGKEYENLIKLQVFCGGTISYKALAAYLAMMEGKAGSKITDFDFRYKQEAADGQVFKNGQPMVGWKLTSLYIAYKNGKEDIIPWKQSVLTNGFESYLLLRPSCFVCPYKGKPTAADLSLGDFGGIENTVPEMFDPLGVSAVIAHTQKGIAAIEGTDNMLVAHEVNVETILKGNYYGILRSVRAHPNRDSFYNEFAQSELPFDTLVRKCLGYGENSMPQGLRFGIFGSHNSRASIMTFCPSCSGEIAYHYSNASVTSLMAAPAKVPEDFTLPGNPFRAEMLSADISKRFVHDAQAHVECIDYLIIDFLEDRFGVIPFGGTYITDSDALADTDFPHAKGVFSMQQWEESCLRFIDFLNERFTPRKIVLHKAFLNAAWKDENDTFRAFDDVRGIDAVNERLACCYTFFEEHYPIQNVIAVQEKQFLFCDGAFKHGCYPWHANQAYYEAVAVGMSKIAEKYTK